MNIPYKKNKLFLFISILTAISLLFSCATGINTTGTKIKLNKDKKNNIRILGIVIEEKEDLSVWLERDDPSVVAPALIATGGWVTLPIGLVWYAIDSSSRNKKDQDNTSSIQSTLAEYSISDDFQEKIFEYAVNANLFDKIVKIKFKGLSESSESNVEAILRVTLLNWGLRRVSDTSENFKKKLLKTEFKIKAEIILNNEEIIWSLDEHYIDENKYLIEDFSNNPQLLKEIVKNAVNDLSKKIVNKILYS